MPLNLIDKGIWIVCIQPVNLFTLNRMHSTSQYQFTVTRTANSTTAAATTTKCKAIVHSAFSLNWIYLYCIRPRMFTQNLLTTLNAPLQKVYREIFSLFFTFFSCYTKWWSAVEQTKHSAVLFSIRCDSTMQLSDVCDHGYACICRKYCQFVCLPVDYHPLIYLIRFTDSLDSI